MCVCVCVPVCTHVRSIKGVRSTGKVNFIPFRPSCHMNLQMKIGMIAFQPFWLVNPPPPNVPLPEIRSFKGKPTFDKPLKRPSFWGCMLRGWLTNHETSSCKMDIAGFFAHVLNHKSVLVYHVGAVLHIGKPVKTFPAKLYCF